MSKTRRKERSETEHLRGEIRKLESENRQLKRQIKQLNKRSSFYEDAVDKIAEDIKIKPSCNLCGKGSIIERDLKFITVIKCDTCEYKEIRKNK